MTYNILTVIYSWTCSLFFYIFLSFFLLTKQKIRITSHKPLKVIFKSFEDSLIWPFSEKDRRGEILNLPLKESSNNQRKVKCATSTHQTRALCAPSACMLLAVVHTVRALYRMISQFRKIFCNFKPP